jgi:energy-coupling factor transporter ATP-binding protein EcfA2
MLSDDFFAAYFSYVGETEAPAIFHRWAAIAGIGAYLGRNYSFNHGHFHIQPNIYSMLIGTAGSRKSTAIKLMKQLLVRAGYDTIAADKTTKEKFLLDLSGEDTGEELESSIDQNLFGGTVNESAPKEIFVMADEFNDFFGNGNIEFISLLGTLWDYNGVYRNRIKNGKSVSICDPTISILGGNTPTGFSLAFPPEILGQGFFSRILLIYGEPTGKKITFPVRPPDEYTVEIIRRLQEIKCKVFGAATLSSGASKLLDKIYKTWGGVDDVRFESYSNRRFTHLLKLCLIHTAARCAVKIEETDVIYANTVLSYTESLMPKALGEFGKARNSDVSHKIIQLLDTSPKVLTLKEIYKHVHNDLERMADLSELLRNLMVADKIQSVGVGFLIKRKVQEDVCTDLINYELLTNEERGLLK